ncbi:MAG: hypothetical protein AB7O32_00525 [Vicinamibacterales bacterium]
MVQVGKLALPGDDLVWTATVSMTDEDADYPATNVQHWNPARLAKATASSTTVTIDCSGNVTPVAVALINTNATSAAISNAAGLNQAITIPALEADGQRIHGWQSLIGLSNVTDDIFDIDLSRPSGVVTIGRIALVVQVYDVNWVPGHVVGIDRPGNVALRTRLGTVIVHDAGIRVRSVDATFDLAEDAPVWRGLERSAKGEALPFLFIPDDTQNDAWWVRLDPSFRERSGLPGFMSLPRRMTELSSGPPNG